MSDQIAVLAEGRIEQVGPPAEIYAAPATHVRGRIPRYRKHFDADVLECGNGSAVLGAVRPVGRRGGQAGTGARR